MFEIINKCFFCQFLCIYVDKKININECDMVEAFKNFKYVLKNEWPRYLLIVNFGFFD